MEQDRFAVVDIGSNSLRLLQGTCDEKGHWQFLPKELATTRLGYDIENTGRLSPAGMEDSFAAMAAWKEKIGTIPVCAVATSAVREAKDGQAFLAEVRARFGWRCRAVTGLEEAAYSFRGAAAAAGDKLAAVIDIGGGSTEFALGRNGQAAWSHSYPFGAVRSGGKTQTFEECVAQQEECLPEWLPLPVQPAIVIGVGGTLTSLAAMELQLDPYDPEQVEGCVIPAERITYWIDTLTAMTAEERRHVKGLQPRRSDIIVAGLVIAHSCLTAYNIPSLTISEQDLLEGVFYSGAFQDAAWFNR